MNNQLNKIIKTQYFLICRYMSKERAGKGIKPGVTMLDNDQPHRVIKIIQGKRGKGGGFVRATLKSITTGSVFEKTYSTDEVIELAEIEKETAQYSWNDDKNYIFLNSETFEELLVPKAAIENEVAEMLVSGQEVKLNVWNKQVLGVTLPNISEYEVLDIDPSQGAGNETAAIIQNGVKILVPEVISKGMKIHVNTELKKFVSKA